MLLQLTRASIPSMASYSFSYSLLVSSFLFLVFFPSHSSAADVLPECEVERGPCHDRSESLKLKIIAIFAILITSMIGVCLPLLSQTISYLRPDGNLFAVVKAFASGVILATGYMHVLPDSFNDLTSPCLPHNPWGKFPFTTFVAMISAIFVLMVDSFMMTFHNKRKIKGGGGRSSGGVFDHPSPVAGGELIAIPSHGHGHGHSHCVLPQPSDDDVENGVAIKRYRTIAQILEMGIVVHSVVIGLSLGASENPCTIRPLVAALCFHQMFEGMGLGGCILQAEYGTRMKAIMFFFFSVTTPFGIALGIALSTVYSDNDPNTLIVVGILNASSAGLLNYMAFVDLLAVDFMGPKLQGSVRLQAWAYVAVLLGAGGMSLMAKWA